MMYVVVWGLELGQCEGLSVGLGLCVRMSVGFVRLDVITKKVSVL
jgi:hypothetical protein